MISPLTDDDEEIAIERRVPLMWGVFDRPCSDTAIIGSGVELSAPTPEQLEWLRAAGRPIRPLSTLHEEREQNDIYPQQMESHYGPRPRPKTTLPPIQRALNMMSRDVTEWQKETPAETTGKISAVDATKPEGSVSQLQGIVSPPTTAATVTSNLTKPTCSLNLICYRPGSQGCVLRQIRVISRARFDKKEDYLAVVEANDGIVRTDIGLSRSCGRNTTSKCVVFGGGTCR